MKKFKSTRIANPTQLKAVFNVIKHRAETIGAQSIYVDSLDPDGSFIWDAVSTLTSFSENLSVLASFQHSCHKVVFLDLNFSIFEMFVVNGKSITRTETLLDYVENSGVDVLLIYKDLNMLNRINQTCATLIAAKSTFCELLSVPVSNTPSCIVSDFGSDDFVTITAPLLHLI